MAEIAAKVDEFISLDIPQWYAGAVGAYYGEFPQVTDEEVTALLSARKTV